MSCTADDAMVLLQAVWDATWPLMLLEWALMFCLGWFWRWTGEKAA